MAIADALMLDLEDRDWLRQTIEQRKQFGGGDHFPRHLYRYIAPDTDATRAKLEDALVNSRLYLCSRTQFNDPFDSRLEWLQPGDEEVRRFIRGAGFRLGIPEHQADQFADNFLAAPQDWPRLNEILNGTLDRLGLSCFSETPSDMLMWSHYGTSHRGVAVEYQAFNRDAGQAMKLFPVVYGKDFPAMLLNAEHSDRQVFRSVMYKARCWGYELEWRVVKPDAARTHVELDSARVLSIYLGCKVEAKTLGLIRELLIARKARGLPDVQVFRMYMQRDAFALVALPYALNA
ncbi:DUF2971 domain-containing protein [Dyella mobilis]|uniref:DUF2971 domain-containing protein n=1 Tax=Dyella mobilis TaxID=1849582 RepID=A0ABS2KJD5_9GAMM|nr:DUF2971 domain-containing protein [Dyella mobilis]MBM7131271.1 DUF2971 domain-containing protein [Dyella mobilis]GLQ98793.1 hypothetical protein GCM10007863_32130 [Dyella mobilis]